LSRLAGFKAQSKSGNIAIHFSELPSNGITTRTKLGPLTLEMSAVDKPMLEH
jgi:hypothetical protein